MYSFVVNKLLFPLHELLRGRETLEQLRTMEERQLLSGEALQELSVSRCKALLQHASDSLPYWSERFERAGFVPADFTSFDDLKKLPVMTKDDVREHPDAMIVAGWKERMVVNHTGGSTGRPLAFYCTRERETVQNAAKLRSRRWWGWDVGDKVIDLWGQPLELTVRERLKRAKDLMLNHCYLSAFSMSPAQMRDYLGIIDRYRPALIYGYATALYQLALQVEGDPSLKPKAAPKVIITTAETLHDYQREAIQKAFGAPVAEEYGAHDGGLMAHRCPAGGYHILSDLVHLETDDDGSALVTNFDSFGMPFIRYRIGDRVVLSERKCSCGLPFPLLEEVCGREYDMVISAAGKKIHGAFFHYMFKADSRVQQFQVIQDRFDRVEIRLVTDGNAPLGNEEAISARIRQEFEEAIEVVFSYVEAIEPEKSGKYLWIICRVAT